MRETEPQVFLISRPALVREGVQGYLAAVKGQSWESLRTPMYHHPDGHGELLVEFAGRACYRSWEPGLNKNVTKIREDQREYFANLLKAGHGSVLEHANYTFAFHNVSRVFTHELVRHRVGVAISQESLRYVRLTELSFRVPPALEPVRGAVIKMVEELESFQRYAAEVCGLDNEGDEFANGQPLIPFAEKKVITSALRRLAPIGLSTGIIWTANIRTLRHVLASRTAVGAEEEMRLVFDGVGRIIRQEAPGLFQDFSRNEDGEWIPANPVAGQTRIPAEVPEEVAT